jgi:hypothetical protein
LCTDPGTAALTPTPNWIDAAEPGGGDLHDPEVVVRDEVGVLAPPQCLVELFGAVHVRDGQDDGLELHVHGGAPLSPVHMAMPSVDLWSTPTLLASSTRRAGEAPWSLPGESLADSLVERGRRREGAKT